MGREIVTQDLTGAEDFQLLTPGKDIVRVGRTPYVILEQMGNIVKLRGSPDGRWVVRDLTVFLNDLNGTSFVNGALVEGDGFVAETYIGGGTQLMEMEDRNTRFRSIRGYQDRREMLIKLGLLKPVEY